MFIYIDFYLYFIVYVLQKNRFVLILVGQFGFFIYESFIFDYFYILEKLVVELDIKFVVFIEEVSKNVYGLK